MSIFSDDIEMEATKNFDIVEKGGELTIPLAVLNQEADFINRYRKKGKRKLKDPVVCIVCGQTFIPEKRITQKMCSKECIKNRTRILMKEYYKTQKYKDFLALKRKRYAENPEIREREKEVQRKYNSRPEVIAMKKRQYFIKKKQKLLKEMSITDKFISK